MTRRERYRVVWHRVRLHRVRDLGDVLGQRRVWCYSCARDLVAWSGDHHHAPPRPPADPFVEADPDDPRLDSAERVLPRDVQIGAEEHLNAMFGLPEVWRCPCGGRPFITEKTCPRCGRKQGERWS